MASSNGIRHYRKAMGLLLSELLTIADEIESWLDVPIDSGGDAMRVLLQQEPTLAFRISIRQLLCKARLHGIALLRANESCNIHSLGVQMRPVLECAGQLTLILKNMTDESGHGFANFVEYSSYNYYQTIIRTAQGQVSHQQLLDSLSSMHGELEIFAEQAKEGGGQKIREVAARKVRRFTQLDKVEVLPEGDLWYRHLSGLYCHGDTGRREGLCHADVSLTYADQLELSCAMMADYSANRIAEMIACVTISAMNVESEEWRADAALKRTEAVRAKTRELRDGAVSSIPNADSPGDAG